MNKIYDFYIKCKNNQKDEISLRFDGKFINMTEALNKASVLINSKEFTSMKFNNVTKEKKYLENKRRIKFSRLFRL